MKKKFRFVYLTDDGVTVAQILSDRFYVVIGNSETMQIKNLKRDWGKNSRWMRYIKQ